MNILKFSRSALESSEDISIIIDIIRAEISKGKTIIIVSAFEPISQKLKRIKDLVDQGDRLYVDSVKELETYVFNIVDELIPIAGQSEIKSKIKVLLNELEEFCEGILLVSEVSVKVYHYLHSFGEIISTQVLHKILEFSKIHTEFIDAKKIIKANDDFDKVSIDLEASSKKINELNEKTTESILLSGSIASTKNNYTIRLGRGGDDYTASIIARTLKANTLTIWSDRSGIMTANKAIVEEAYPIKILSFEEALELLHFGEKVLCPPSIHPIIDTDTIIKLRNIHSPNVEGTTIGKNAKDDKKIIKGISCISNIALITVSGSGMTGIHGIAQRLFNSLSVNKINVIFITQSSSEHTITIGIMQEDMQLATSSIEKEFASEIKLNKIDKVKSEYHLSVIALVGDNMKKRVGLSGEIFHALGKNGINVIGIAQGSTERNISIVISNHYERKALNVLHENLFLSKFKTIHVFIIGIGNVGTTLIDQINKQQAYLQAQHLIKLKLIGIANSKKMLFDENGIDLSNFKQQLNENSSTMIPTQFIDTMKELNLQNSVFVDNTASKEISQTYSQALSSSISVVTANKIAASAEYAHYKHLNQLAKNNNVNFLYETNVGAGLPIIKTIHDLILSGDKIVKIEAVLSGSLNFIFDIFSAEISFHEAVKQAQEEGYTEPDPRIDLSGIDVMRKILILVRESGANFNIESVNNEQFLPPQCINTASVKEFYEQLKENKNYFDKLRIKAEKENGKLKFVAQYDGNKATTGLQTVDKYHPFYNLVGKDNIVLLTTKRYHEQPIVVKGAGAGAEVTASGVFTDIIRAVNE